MENNHNLYHLDAKCILPRIRVAGRCRSGQRLPAKDAGKFAQVLKTLTGEREGKR
jgi:hypothetical protein